MHNDQKETRKPFFTEDEEQSLKNAIGEYHQALDGDLDQITDLIGEFYSAFVWHHKDTGYTASKMDSFLDAYLCVSRVLRRVFYAYKAGGFVEEYSGLIKAGEIE